MAPPMQPADVFELPLFPLHTVLFPHQPLPLRIFEPRYRQMLDHCMEADRTFGVVLIRRGSEVGEPAEPHEIGTVANIQDIQPQADGTLGVITEGTRRFRLLEVTQQRPYQVGLVEYLQDYGDPPSQDQLKAIGDLSLRCLRLSLGMSGEWIRRANLPKDPEQMSYVLSARLPRGPRTKQRLLSARTTTDRLKELTPLMELEEQRLTRQLQDRMWLTSSNLN